jgi:hypothetical protein
LPLILCKCTNHGRTTAITWNTGPIHMPVTALATLWLWWLVTGLSIQRPRFKHRPVHVGFMVSKVPLGQVFFLSTSNFSPVTIIPYKIIHSSVSGISRPQHLTSSLHNTLKSVSVRHKNTHYIITCQFFKDLLLLRVQLARCASYAM